MISGIMKINDISVSLNRQAAVWPGDEPIRTKTISSRQQGDTFHISKFTLGTHSGTHIDAPFHLIESGRKLSEIPLSQLILPIRVVQYDEKEHISREFVRSLSFKNVAGVLFKTANSRWWENPSEPFHEDFIALTPAAASELAGSGLKLIGIDYFSIEPFDSVNYIVHQTLLQKNIVILENANLSAVVPGKYQLICLPLKLEAPDGAPVRAVLLS